MGRHSSAHNSGCTLQKASPLSTSRVHNTLAKSSWLVACWKRQRAHNRVNCRKATSAINTPVEQRVNALMVRNWPSATRAVLPSSAVYAPLRISKDEQINIYFPFPCWGGGATGAWRGAGTEGWSQVVGKVCFSLCYSGGIHTQGEGSWGPETGLCGTGKSEARSCSLSIEVTSGVEVKSRGRWLTGEGGAKPPTTPDTAQDSRFLLLFPSQHSLVLCVSKTSGTDRQEKSPAHLAPPPHTHTGRCPLQA